MVKMRFQTSIIKAVKEKRELQNLDDDYVLTRVKAHMHSNPKAKKKLLAAQDFKRFARSKEFEALKKDVRKKLRSSYGLFDADDSGHKEALIKALKDDPSDVDLNRSLLATHQSSKERLPYYTKLYRDIFAITEEPGVVLDIGCGYNPISYPFLGCTPQYFACDIATKDMQFLERFFKHCSIDGEAFTCDAIERPAALVEYARKSAPDIIFLFKAIDTLASQERHTTKGLLSQLVGTAKWIVASFATMSVGGNKMIHDARRSWFEKFLDKEGLEYEVVEIPNEKFYVIQGKRE